MEIEWPDGRCVLCCREGRSTETCSLTDEHLIPKSIGGVLTSRLLCARCNSTLGQYEADLKEGPAVRLVIGNLKCQLPVLFHRISEGQQFVALEPGKVQDALRRFDEAQENTRVTVAPGFDIIKWTVTGIDPALDARRLAVCFDGGEEKLQGAGIAVLKIAYKYLALHLGAAIFGNVFSSIRKALAGNDPSLCPYHVKWMRGPKPALFHGLVVEKKPSYLVIQARLFGELAYRIHFAHLIPGEGFTRCKYTHDLTNGKEILEEA